MTYTPRYESPEDATRLMVARGLAQYIDSLRAPPCSLRNILASAAGLEPLGEAERQVRDRMELLRGQRLLGETIVPWSLLTRTMGTATGPSGGYLAEMDVLPMADALRGESNIIAAGAQVFDNLTASLQIPRLLTKPTMYWTAEGAAGASSDPAVGAASARPRMMLGIIPVSVQLLKLSSAETPLRDVLRRGCADAFDVAAVAGAGGAEPLGIINTGGVGTASGTSLSYSSIWTQVEALVAAGARMNELFFVTGATAGRILATRERASGSGYILDGGRIAGIPCTVTPNVPASTLVLGVASQLAISVWGAGPEIRSSQSSGFNTATVDLRIKLDCDVAVLNPSAFVVFGTVT